MRRLAALAVVTAALLGTSPAFGAEPLASRVKQADGWVSWDVPMIAGAGDPCCWSGHGDHAEGRIGCDLDGRNHGFSTNDQPKPPTTGTLTVYAHVTHARCRRRRRGGSLLDFDGHAGGPQVPASAEGVKAANVFWPRRRVPRPHWTRRRSRKMRARATSRTM